MKIKLDNYVKVTYIKTALEFNYFQRSLFMRIGDMARKTNTSIRTIRYYEEMGLVSPSNRSTGGFREYNKENLDKVVIIQKLKALGLTLSEIKELFTIKKKTLYGGEAAKKIYDFFDKRSVEIDEKLEKLGQIKTDIEMSKSLIKKCFECKIIVDECKKNCNINGIDKEIPKLLRTVI